MVKQGVAPEDIANHFGIAISSVHNYKNRFKAEGLDFPSVRGKRPTGSVEVNHTSPGGSEVPIIKSTGEYKFVVNGISVQISSEAKDVRIDKDGIKINF
jgi:hypothetical protein